MESHDPFRRAQFDNATLDHWVNAGWLIPQQHSAGPRFSDVDIARAHLIGDLQDLGVNEDSIPIILDLVDQLHGLRHVLREILLTMKAQRQEQDRA